LKVVSSIFLLNYLAMDLENGWRCLGLKTHILAMLLAPSAPWVLML
jgi:hypothetical protein